MFFFMGWVKFYLTCAGSARHRRQQSATPTASLYAAGSKISRGCGMRIVNRCVFGFIAASVSAFAGARDKGPKTIGNTLANYDEALRQINAALFGQELPRASTVYGGIAALDGRRIRRRNTLKPRPAPPYWCMPG